MRPGHDILRQLDKLETKALFEVGARMTKAEAIADFLYPALELYADDEAAFDAASVAYACMDQEARTQLAKVVGVRHPSPVVMGMVVMEMRKRAAIERELNLAESHGEIESIESLFDGSQGVLKLAEALTEVIDRMVAANE